MILVVATTGEGDATDNAIKFNRYITAKSTPTDALTGLKYTVFGLGDLNYINFNQMGKRTEINMDRLGALKIYPRGIGDASQDIEADLRRWIDGGLIETVRENVPNLTKTGSKPVVVLNSGIPDLLELKYSPSQSPVKTKGSSTLSKVFWTLSEGSIIKSSELRQESDEKSSTREIVLKISDIYEPCDSIEILPRNSSESFNWMIKRFRISESSLNDLIDFDPKSGNPTVKRLPFPTPCTLAHALCYYIDIQTCPTRTFLSNLAVLNRSNPEVEEALSALANDAHLMKDLDSHFVSVRDLIELFDHAFGSPLKISLSEFLQIAPKQRVRAYTGASIKNEKNEAKIIVSLTARDKPEIQPLLTRLVDAGILPSVATFARESNQFRGTCSGYLCNPVSEKIFYRVRPSVLRPPADNPPVVLAIVTGAGIAPVMAYLEACKQASMYLVFGCQSSSKDFLYREKLLENPRVRSWFAFSREGNRKVYVQDLVRETKEIHQVISDICGKGGRILICGNTSMGRSVCEVIASQIGGQSQLESLEKCGKLVVEYFG